MIKFLDILTESDVKKEIKDNFPIKVQVFQTWAGNYRIEIDEMTYETFQKLGNDNLSVEELKYGTNLGYEYTTKQILYPNDVRSTWYDYKTGEAWYLASTMKDVENWLKKYRNFVIKQSYEDVNPQTSDNSEVTENEITERCWKGYTQKGMKTMFGKRYPNCVKK